MTTPKRLDEPTIAFDLDAWLNDARVPERTATVYGRGDLHAEYTALDEELGALRNNPDTGMMVSTSTARAAEVAARMTEVRNEMLASKLTIRLRALSKDQIREITAAAEGLPEADQNDYTAEQWIAAAAVSPAFTAEQVRALRAHIGEGQFAGVWDTAFAVANTKVLDVPFSPRHSAALLQPTT